MSSVDVAELAAQWRAAQAAERDHRQQLAAAVQAAHKRGVSIYRLALIVGTDANTVKRWLRAGG
jgi:ABC-type tungstate transport system substrate-binding protein